MSAATTAERKEVEARLLKLNAKIDETRAACAEIQREVSRLVDQRVELESRLDALKPKAITVSDHAVLRYLERVAGVDVDEIRNGILGDEKLAEYVDVFGGNGKFPVADYRVVMRDYTIVTIEARR